MLYKSQHSKLCLLCKPLNHILWCICSVLRYSQSGHHIVNIYSERDTTHVSDKHIWYRTGQYVIVHYTSTSNGHNIASMEITSSCKSLLWQASVILTLFEHLTCSFYCVWPFLKGQLHFLNNRQFRLIAGVIVCRKLTHTYGIILTWFCHLRREWKVNIFPLVVTFWLTNTREKWNKLFFVIVVLIALLLLSLFFAIKLFHYIRIMIDYCAAERTNILRQ